MQKEITFLTGSRFEGSFNPSTNCMDGFGCYIYPNGSEYRGFFKRGRFHGYGRLRLSKPYSFTFIGEFTNGALTTIDELIYPDGLHMIATLSADGMSAEKWRYCTEKDRRYPGEIVMGLTPVGQASCTTRFRTARNLQPNTYDTEEGIFVDSSGFVTQIPPPFNKQRFVNCNAELEWIHKTCRRSAGQSVEPDVDIGRRIIEVNIRETIKKSGDVLYPMTILDERHIAKFCRRLAIGREDEEQLESSSESTFLDYKTPPSSMSTSSFSENTLLMMMECNELQATELAKTKTEQTDEGSFDLANDRAASTTHI